MKADTKGRPYAAVAAVPAGSLLEVDGGFTCMARGEVRQVQRDDGGLYVACKDGKHYLDGQLNSTSNVYVGMYLR